MIKVLMDSPHTQWEIGKKGNRRIVALNGEIVAQDIGGKGAVEAAYKQMLLQLNMAFKSIMEGT